MQSEREQETRIVEPIAYQGEPGAYSEAAVGTFFGAHAATLPCPQFSDVFTALALRQAMHAVVPIENSTAGGVAEVHDLLVSFEGVIVGEAYATIEHCLLALPGVALRELRRVVSHPQALSQCRQFLVFNRIEAVPSSDTAGAARMLAESRDRFTGVLASAQAAKLYGLSVLVPAIQDSKSNTTRFLALSGQRQGRVSLTGADKTSMIVVPARSPCTLARSLDSLASLGLEVTRIEARPIPERPWQYRFFLDFEHAPGEAAARAAIEACARDTEWHKVLGTYASARRQDAARRESITPGAHQ
jgi:prephenate dehydratase